ncbi:MAG: DsbA family oxidoreductase [Myxococcota bacterium]
MEPPRLALDIWSDIACPWCWVGKRRLEAALADFPHRDWVDVRWRAFELDPMAPPVHPADLDFVARLAGKYGTDRAGAQGMIDRMTRVAAGEGLTMRFDRIRPGNTFDAHRLLHLGAHEGCQTELKERLFCAYLEEGRAIGDRAVLHELGIEAGLEPGEVEAVLESDRFADDVRREERTGQQLGMTKMPFFVAARTYGVSGAQPAKVLRTVLDQGWGDVARVGIEELEAGASCGVDGCR